MKTNEDLIRKYNKPGPRYTSYPPVPFWNQAPSEDLWISHVKRNYDASKGFDLYVHVPYCESLCYYCGCNRTITKDHANEDRYLGHIMKEWDMYCERLKFSPKVHSLHFGGGTPTFLAPGNLQKLIQYLVGQNGLSTGSIEIDPRTCQRGHLEVLKSNGFSRLSLGIQDFDPVVQKAIHRDQSVSMVKALVEKIRGYGFESLNFDLIYGLPKQTIASIEHTIEKVIEMKPDLIAFYSYAHLPDKIKNQKLIKEADLPNGSEKRSLYEKGKELLLKAGYVDIGMDHFALPENHLYQAKLNKKLHRNFMGYVDKKTPVLIGLGPTSISDSSQSFIQNFKELHQYEKSIELGKLPIEKGHVHTDEDLRVQKTILSLLCHEETTFTENHPELREFEKDGLIELQGNRLQVTPAGKPFIRNVAMSFDVYLKDKSSVANFSKTI